LLLFVIGCAMAFNVVCVKDHWRRGKPAAEASFSDQTANELYS